MGTIAAIAALAIPATAQAAPSACQSNASMRPNAENISQVESTVLCLVNAERTRRGLARLKANDRLENAATKHSRDMVKRRFFAHDTPGGSGPADRIKDAGYLSGARGWTVGENLAWGTGSYATPQRIVDGWMHSAGHKANILRGNFKEIGVGVALGAPGRDGGATYTTTFGARL